MMRSSMGATSSTSAALVFLFRKPVKERRNIIVDAIRSAYRPLLNATLRWRWIVIVVGLLWVAAHGVLATRLGAEFVPNLDEGDIAMHALRIPGTSLDQAIRLHGARNITSVAVDSRGTPWVAYSDTARLSVASLDGTTWRTQSVAESGDQPLGQLVSLDIDGDDGLHIAYFEGRSPGPIGTVKYAKGTHER